ncbi:nuclear transport factor 2 family protein [Nocardia brasiliensis]|uniref:nuclear transport factor 2 family protein n=1 Tax=Nocardia brasiliensis TaxID=37326 RepID=UPI00245401B6|nr:nuclear transport factor 2 family protein [Nocardia brasiliensis]
MALTKQYAQEVVATYIRAWVSQDPDLIVSIFADHATYHERVLDDPIVSREGIRHYWKTKVVESQGNIECDLLSLYVDGDTAIAEWEARFDDLVQGKRKRMREVAILEFDEHLIVSLREYWTSQTVQ